MFHEPDVPYILNTINLAPQYDVNTVVFSHDIIGYASQLLDGSNRGARIVTLAKAAHAENLNAWIWVREFQNVQPQFMANGKVQLDRRGFWEWLAYRYEQVFSRYPEFDGLMLTFDETPYRVFDTAKVESALSMPDRFAEVMNVIDAVAVRHGKDFIVRSFVYEPQEMQWFKEGYAQTGKHVTIQTKCEPHDSALPTFRYADEHLHISTMAKWYPNEGKYKGLEDRLLSPDPDLLEQIRAERTRRSRWPTPR